MNTVSINKGIRKIAWGYLVLVVQLSIGTIQFVPGWIGFYLVYQGIRIIGQEEESTLLLRPLAIFFGGLAFFEWILTMMNISIHVYIFDIIIISLELYFHFQLLTNISHIVLKYDMRKAKSLRTLAIVRTISMTAYFFLEHWYMNENISILIIVVSFIVELRIILLLFSCSKTSKVEMET